MIILNSTRRSFREKDMPRFSKMKTALIILCSSIGGALGQTPGGPVTSPEAAASVGTGPYPAGFFADPTLQNHTIYQPRNIPPGVKMPVLVWANGGCIAVGTMMMPFLVQVASQGIVVIANGAPGNVTGSYESFGSAPKSTSKYLAEAVDWAVRNASKGKYAHMDASRIGAAGQSCGGLEAYGMVQDTRVSTIGIFNSGGAMIGNLTTNTNATVKSTTIPTFYILGGSTDIAYINGEADYAMLPATTPAWKGNLPVGHGGTYNEVNGGKIGVAASYMYDWILRGNATASSFFTSDVAAKAAGWDVVSRNLEKIKTTPLRAPRWRQ